MTKKKRPQKKIIIRSVPLDLKAAIADEVNAGSYSSMNDAIRSALSTYFDVPYEATETQPKQANISDTPRISLVIDERLDRKIEQEAFRSRTTKRNVMIEALCSAFDVPFEPTGRWIQTA